MVATKRIKTELYSPGRWDVLHTDENGQYPVRVGHIIGARKVYLAESGPTNLGYYTSKKNAVAAIAKHRNI